MTALSLDGWLTVTGRGPAVELPRFVYHSCCRCGCWLPRSETPTRCEECRAEWQDRFAGKGRP